MAEIKDTPSEPGCGWFVPRSPHGCYVKPLKTVADCLCGEHPWPKQPMVRITDLPGHILASPPRTGSTVVYQIINSLINPIQLIDGREAISHDLTISRSHELFTDSCPILREIDNIFYCIRHPYDIIHSYSQFYKETNMSIKIIDNIFQDIKPLCALMTIQNTPVLKQKLLANRPDMKFTIIRYEDFWSDTLKLTKFLAYKLNPTKQWDEHHIHKITRLTDIRRNYQISRTINEYDESSYIHPNHINKRLGQPGAGSQIPEKFKQYIIEHYSEIFEVFEYQHEYK